MIHQFQLNGYNIVVDVYSGSVHAVDPLAYDAIALIDAGDSREQAAAKLAKKYADHPEVTDADIADALDDIDELTAAVDKARRMRRQATEDNMRQLIEQMRRGGYRWRERFLLPGGVIIGRVLVCLGVCFHVLFFTCLPAYSVVSELQV